jgi:hypothetical protein
MRGRKDSTSEKSQEFRLAFSHCIPYTMRASEEEKSVEMRLELKKWGKIKGKTNLLKNYSFCLMVEASDHGYVLHTRRIHVTRYRI